MQHQITEAHKLLDAQGHLVEPGYATSLLLEYDRRDIRAQGHRIKEWDYYLIYNENYAVALTVADNYYMGLVGASLIDLKAREEITTNVISLFPMGKMMMPPTSRLGDIDISTRRLEIGFHNDGMHRELHLEMQKFKGSEPLIADFTLFEEPQDSMVIATPFPKKENAFYYNQKIIGMKARGSVQFKGETIEFSPQDTLGLLDWGRGVWTYENVWYWGAAQGYIDGNIFGFNIGYGFGDTGAASENMLFLDGVAHKLEQVEAHIPVDEAGHDDYLRPWQITSSDGRFEMEFQPILDRASYTSFGFILSDQHQVFGRFSGKAKLDDGRVVNLRDFTGFVEKVRNKW